MLQFGICSVDRFRPPASGRLGHLRTALRPHRVSLQLLRTGTPPSPRELAVFEHLVVEILGGNGVYRTTYRGRFADVDPAVNALLLARFGRDAAVAAHDWAASSCLTSAEWAQTLFAALPRASLSASDLVLFLVEVTLPNGDVFVVEPHGHALQYIRPPFVIRLNPPEPFLFLINRLIGRRAAARLAAHDVEIPDAWLDADDEELALPAARLRKMPVTHADARALAAADPRFRICRHSAFEPLAEPADVIRTMNIFNRDYFAAGRLADGVRAVWSSLRPGGIWIVGRTLEKKRRRNDVTIFAKSEHGFDVVERLGAGSEMEALVLS
jgi:hypothetical protein